MAEAGFGESMVANSELDITALRRYRNKPGMGNILSRQRNELFAPIYRQVVYPPNSMLNEEKQAFVPERSHFIQTQMNTIQSLRARNVIKEDDSDE
jgi:hypothetical protein